jgi:hypothetical protein
MSPTRCGNAPGTRDRTLFGSGLAALSQILASVIEALSDAG